MGGSKPRSPVNGLVRDLFTTVRTIYMHRGTVRLRTAHFQKIAVTFRTALFILTCTVGTQQIEIPTPFATNRTPGHQFKGIVHVFYTTIS